MEAIWQTDVYSRQGEEALKRPSRRNEHAASAKHKEWSVLLSCGVILTLALIAGMPTIRQDNYFLADDFGLVQHLHQLTLERFLSYFVSDWTEGIYGFKLDELRPLLAFTYWLDGRMFGATNAQGYHATNVVLHMLNGLLVFAIARSVAPGRKGVALLAGSLFVLIPSHAEPVSWISGRVDSLAALFYLGAFLCFVQFRLRQRASWWFAALFIFAGGLFAKQSLVTFPILILAYDAVYAAVLRRPIRSLFSRFVHHVPFFVLLAMYLGLREILFGNAVREDVLSLGVFKQFLYRQYFYATNLMPIGNSFSASIKAGLAVFTVAVLAVSGWWVLVQPKRDWPGVQRLIFFGAIWYAITIAPMVVTYESARHLYLTCAGWSIAVASLILPEGLRAGRKAARVAAAGALVALYAAAMTANVRVWVANGLASQKFAVALPRMLQSLPRGSVVLVGVPKSSQDAWLWAWALPFALQKPFLPENLYQQFAIVEVPEVYCCPSKQWWTAKQLALSPLLSSAGPHDMSVILAAPQDNGTLTLTRKSVRGDDLRRKIEHAIGKPVGQLSSGITDAEALVLSRILLE